jgi:FixJ family two-component response regulator
MVKENSIVYVIDDDEPIRKAFSRLLRSADIAAETFSCPEDFLAGVRQKENACIIADLHMPGSTGFDLEKELTNRGLKIPVIVVSAGDDAKSREHARTLGAVAFFRKPVDDQALLDAVWWALSETAERKKTR